MFREPAHQHERGAVGILRQFFSDRGSPSDTQADCGCHRTLFVSGSGLENAKRLVSDYKTGRAQSMTPEMWQAKKIVDSTLHPGAFGIFQ